MSYLKNTLVGADSEIGAYKVIFGVKAYGISSDFRVGYLIVGYL